MKPPIGHNTPLTDGWVLSAEQIKKSLGRPTRRLLQHPMGDRDSRHRMDERRMRTASIGAVVFLYRSETPKIFISHHSHLLAIKQY